MAEKVCPFWIGYLLSSPVRKLWHNPERILEPYINEGMKVVDLGCAMGFFSLPIAEMVGKDGKVICVDIQKKMISSLEKKAKKAGLLDRIETHICSESSFCLDYLNAEIDFVLAFAVVHEIPEPAVLFSQVCRALKSEGKLLIAEPKGRVSEEQFEISVQTAKEHCFEIIDRPHICSARTALLQKQPYYNGVKK
jgi:ubiquinone/menaquinone biosynthesis C-methylase UbiE